MALKLNRPVVTQSHEPASSAETARFISGANTNKQVSKAKLFNFRLPVAFDNIIETEATRTGQSRTTVLKAALAAFDNLDENQKNHWLLESAKIG
ncbi:CopG family transcriptional regulator (plasmid) [Edwardsiella tarda]|uniref:CopG family transcriptional regulator n=1 Tax=Edwardsiella tarda TaxID=636 RepID=UPI0015E82335|nr:CopG family transcriptional regulator [Edwardsiella tarda]UCQ29632.1 CopG family transcriptional regulator [Edwardsiella tarda]